jgi:hypothetical protein
MDILWNGIEYGVIAFVAIIMICLCFVFGGIFLGILKWACP